MNVLQQECKHVQVQQQLTWNPNMMREMMKIMRSLVVNNPQIQAIIDWNSELPHILNDLGIL